METMTGTSIVGWDEPPETIEFWHLDAEVQRASGDWFGGWVPRGARRDGNRSILLPLPTGRWIKIKGAGLNGGPVDFSSCRRTGPKSLWFDFEGRVAEDVSSGHDAAHPGGASFQQAVTEWTVSARLQRAAERVLPCLGYGRITLGDEVSWFTVFEWSAHYGPDATWPHVSAKVYSDRVAQVGATALRLALRHGLIGYPWLMPDGAGGQIIKDLHPFRQADPVNMSQISFAMHLFHALHIMASDIRIRAGRFPGLPEDVHLAVFRAVLPEVTLEDHSAAIRGLLGPYMLKPEAGFRVGDLVKTLHGNPLTARLMDLVPETYARFGARAPGQSRSASSAL